MEPKTKKLIFKILLIVIVIVLVILALAVYLLQIPRYHWLRKRSALLHLDRTFKERKAKKEPNRDRIVVSLSTIPDRIHLMGPTLASWMDQTVLPDEICINVPLLSRKGKEYTIPEWMTDLENVTIYRVDEDEGPGTKLLPTLRRERSKPNGNRTRIICGDDDNIYNAKTIEILTRVHRHYEKKGKLVAVSNYGVTLNCDEELPGIPERVRTLFVCERRTDLLQGFSGFLVTPEMIPEQAYDIHSGPKEVISVDDIWFSGWLNLNGIPIISPGYIFLHLPIVSFGEMRDTPALAKGENKHFVTDMKVIRWFIDDMGFVPVRRLKEHSSL
jgi:hypothetical protein